MYTFIPTFVDGLYQYDAMMPPGTGFTSYTAVKWLTGKDDFKKWCSINMEALRAYFMWGRERAGWNTLSSHDSVADVGHKGSIICSVFKSLRQCMLLAKGSYKSSPIDTSGIHKVIYYMLMIQC